MSRSRKGAVDKFGRNRSGATTQKKQKKPSTVKRIAFKAKTLGCGALKLTDFTSLNEQMEKYVIAEQAHDKAKMEKAKRKWKMIMKCQIDRINRTQKKQIKYDDGVLDANFNQKRNAQARKILNKIGVTALVDHFKIQLKF